MNTATTASTATKPATLRKVADKARCECCKSYTVYRVVGTNRVVCAGCFEK